MYVLIVYVLFTGELLSQKVLGVTSFESIVQFESDESTVLLCPDLFMHTITIPRFIVMKSALNDPTKHIKVMASLALPRRGAVEKK